MKGPSWVNVVLGAWLIIAPWVVGYHMTSAMVEDVVLGIAVVVVGLASVGAGLATTGLAWTNLVLGAWVIIAPWVIGYAGVAGGAATNDVIVGILVVIFAGIRIAAGRQMAVGAAPPPGRY